MRTIAEGFPVQVVVGYTVTVAYDPVDVGGTGSVAYQK